MLTLLLASMLSVAIHVVPFLTGGPIKVGAEHPAQAIWVEPDFFDTLEKDEEFTVSIMVNITNPPGPATGLYAWEYKLKWNTTWLSLKSTAEPDLSTDFGWPNGDWVKKNVIAGDKASVWCCADIGTPDIAFTGVMWLSNYTFRVEKNVYEPDPTHTDYIKMDLIGLVDDTVANIVPPFTDKQVVEFRVCPIPPYVEGDVNDDGIVDIHDIVICALAFGSKPEDPAWNPVADIRQDGIIDIFDLVTIAINFGKTL